MEKIKYVVITEKTGGSLPSASANIRLTGNDLIVDDVVKTLKKKYKNVKITE